MMLDFIKAPIDLRGGTEAEIAGIRYKPAAFGLGDCCFAADESGFHCFYIARSHNQPIDCHNPAQETAIGHGFGKDIFALAEVSDALRTRPGACDNGHVWAPSVVYNCGQWHMFYTAVTDVLYQTIAVAHSSDLHNWTVEADNTVIDCGRFPWAQSNADGYTNCRDPYVVRFGDTWYCYYTAYLPNGNACLGVCTSHDLALWRDRGFCLERPYQNGESAGTEMCESPCIFQKDGLYYAVYNQGKGLKYAVSRDPLDFRQSSIYALHLNNAGGVPYNFELLDADTGLFGYLCGGYYSYAGFGFCDIQDGIIRAKKA